MNLIKRITTSVTATLDQAVGQLENHDAIIEATIKETRKSVARTKARINTLRQQLSVFENQLEQAREQSHVWESRARQLAETDQEKALQCLQRRNHLEQEQQRLDAAIDQQQQLISKVQANLTKLQAKHDEMQHKHTLLRSRQTVADVNKAVASSQCQQDLDDTFERWESLVLEHELNNDEAASIDPLAQEFERNESDAALQAQLAALVVDNKEQNDE